MLELLAHSGGCSPALICSFSSLLLRWIGTGIERSIHNLSPLSLIACLIQKRRKTIEQLINQSLHRLIVDETTTAFWHREPPRLVLRPTKRRNECSIMGLVLSLLITEVVQSAVE